LTQFDRFWLSFRDSPYASVGPTYFVKDNRVPPSYALIFTPQPIPFRSV
jgi:hypothetical protein